MELMRKALSCDAFLCSSNAISENGRLVDIDSCGDAVAAMIFGPKQAIVLAGTNKAVKTVKDALPQARTIAASVNMRRLPSIAARCGKTGGCADCAAGDAACDCFVTVSLSKPAGRIKAISAGKNSGL